MTAVCTTGPFGEVVYGQPWAMPGRGFDPLDPRKFTATLTATPAGYGIVHLSWKLPINLDISNFAVVRANYGHPIARYDGVVLLEEEADTPLQSEDDADLTPGIWYYYSLFCQEEISGRWVRVATAESISVRDWGYHDEMWRSLPLFYRTMDRSMVSRVEQGPLYRFMQLFAFELSLLRTFAGTAERSRSVEEVGVSLLPSLAADLGVGYETSLGAIRMRGILRGLLGWRRDKGSMGALERLVRTISACGDAYVETVPNILLDHNDSNFTEGLGRWRALSNCTIVREADPSPGPRSGVGYLKVTATANGDLVAASADASNILKEGVKVQPLTVYSASAYIRHSSTARVGAVSIEWYTLNGTLVDTVEMAANTDVWGPYGEVAWGEVHRYGPGGPEGSPVEDPLGFSTQIESVAGSSANWQTRVWITTSSPPEARWARVVVTFAGASSGEVHYVDEVQLEQSYAPTDFEPARKVKAYACGARMNLITNPSFELGAQGWSASNTELTTSMAAPNVKFGDRAIVLEPLSNGVVNVSTPVVVKDNSYLTFSMHMRALDTPVRFILGIEWLDADDLVIDSNGSEDVLVPGAIRRRSVTAVAPEGTERAILSLAYFPDSGQRMAIDAAQAEHTIRMQEYFDGSFGGADYRWAGMPHNSPSAFVLNRSVYEDVISRYLDEYVPGTTPWEIIYTI